MGSGWSMTLPLKLIDIVTLVFLSALVNKNFLG